MMMMMIGTDVVVMAARHLQPLISILTPIYWTTAVEVGHAVNGYTLTQGNFRREVQVEFATGKLLLSALGRHGPYSQRPKYLAPFLINMCTDC